MNNFTLAYFDYFSIWSIPAGVIGADAGTIGCTKKPGDEQAEERITVLGK